jgi:hypothetical protein
MCIRDRTGSTAPQTGTVVRATGGFGLDNSQTLDGQWLFQPRAGFNYTFDSDLQMQLRGGVGLFEGSAANVWLSNPYSNTGLATRVVGCGISGFAACTALSNQFIFSPDPNAQLSSFSGVVPAANVDFLSKDLKQPSVWKANLAFERDIGWGDLVFNTEFVSTIVQDGIYYKHLNLGNATRQGTDGRDLFYTPQAYNAACWSAGGSLTTSGTTCTGARTRALNNASFNNVLLAERTGKGGGNTFTMGLSRPMKNNWSWGLAYTYTDAKEVSNLSSSVSNSSWASRAIFNPNEEVSANSAYLVKDRYTGNFTWKHQFFGTNNTSFAVFYEGRKGKPYSWTYYNDLNGDGSSNDLMYIPSAQGSGEVVFRDNGGAIGLSLIHI